MSNGRDLVARRSADIDPAGTPRPLWVELVVNAVTLPEPARILEQSSRYFLPLSVAQEAGLNVAENTIRDLAGERFVDVGAIARATASFDEAEQRLMLHLPPETFVTQTLNGTGSGWVEAMPAGPGLLLTYDGFAQASSDGEQGGALLQPRLFGSWGSVYSSFALTAGETDSRAVRLDSAYERNIESAPMTVRLGDGISLGPAWSGPVRFGGFQIYRDFSLQPGFVTTPSINLGASAELPSTVEVFVDGARRITTEVEPGPFVIEDLPGVAGANAAEIVITDPLGRQQVVTGSFYRSAALLRPGISDFAAQAGWLRKHFGDRSADYGKAVASGTLRHGVTDWLTFGTAAEGSSDFGAGGASADIRFGNLGVLGLDLAASGGSEGAGRRVVTSYQYAGGGWAVFLRGATATEAFEAVGFRPRPERIDREAFGSLDLSLDDFDLGGLMSDDLGGVSIAASLFERQDGEEDGFLSGAWRLPRILGGYSSLNATHFFDQEETIVTFSVAFSFGAGTSAFLGARHDTDGLRPFAGGRQRWEDGPRDYEAYASWSVDRNDDQLFAAGAVADLEPLRVALDAERRGERDAARLSTIGQALWFDDGLWFARRQGDSFVLVDAGFSDVPVYRENRLAGHTDASGRLLLSGLRSYETNRLRIDEQYVPVTAMVDRLDWEVIPPRNAAVKVDFGVEAGHPARLRLLGRDGRPVAEGTRVMASDGTSYPVGRDGQIFLPDVRSADRLSAALPDATCEYRVSTAASGRTADLPCHPMTSVASAPAGASDKKPAAGTSQNRNAAP